MVANILCHTVADQLEMLESVPAAQSVWLRNRALVEWVPTTVEWYSKSLAEWQGFAEIRGEHCNCPPVGLVLSFADWIK